MTANDCFRIILSCILLILIFILLKEPIQNKEGHWSHHSYTTCRVLSQLFNSSQLCTPIAGSTPTACSTSTETSTACYDTGIDPITLCDNRDAFTTFEHITPLIKVLLGNDTTHIFINIVIDAHHIILQAAYILSTPTLLLFSSCHFS